MTEIDLGYIFYPKIRKTAPGGSQLDVMIAEHPSYQHFDPEVLTFMVIDKNKGLFRMPVSHLYLPEVDSYQVGAGRIILKDRKGKVIEAFCFGGSVSIHLTEGRITSQFKSPAPIIQLSTAKNPPDIFVDEVEVLLAQRHAACEAKGTKYYEDKLAAAAPLALYIACLQGVIDRVHKLALEMADEHLHQVAVLVQKDMDALREANQLPTVLPTLEKLL